jgi:hypothetical protein
MRGGSMECIACEGAAITERSERGSSFRPFAAINATFWGPLKLGATRTPFSIQSLQMLIEPAARGQFHSVFETFKFGRKLARDFSRLIW